MTDGNGGLSTKTDTLGTGKIKALQEELEVINKSLKGKKTVAEVKNISDMPTSNSKEDLFNIMKELYALSNKLLSLIPEPGIDTKDAQPENLNNIIRNQLNDILPGLLKEALSTSKINKPSEDTKETPKDDNLPTKHTLVVECNKSNNENATKTSSKDAWKTAEWKKVKGALKNVPVSYTHLTLPTKA